MKCSLLISLGLLFGSLAASAQFNSGSTGTVALNITANTTTNLPPDGILHFTTITVASNATLRFNRNSKNTPAYLLATGDVTVDGTIDVSGGNASITNPREPGRGGPGGFDGGWPGDGGVLAGSGYGPGGGRPGSYYLDGTARHYYNFTAGAGSYRNEARNWDGSSPVGYASTNKGTAYGSALLVPLLGGSGGGGFNGVNAFPGIGGGGGGGAILIASSTRIVVTGSIRANGGDGLTDEWSGALDHLNPGSGGAIRLVAPVVEGSGTLSATVGNGRNAPNNYGRIRIDSLDRRNLSALSSIPSDRSVGNYMVVFPTPTPRLDLVHVAGSNIVQGSGPVTIQLPNNASTNQPVTVQAQHSRGTTPIQIAVIPQNGPTAFYTTNIADSIAAPATVTITVIVPLSTPVTVSAWTKVP